MNKYIITVALACSSVTYTTGFYLFHWGYYENEAKAKATKVALKDAAKSHSTFSISRKTIENYTMLGLLTVGTLNLMLAAYYHLKK